MTSTPRARSFNWRKLLFDLHGWLGLNLGLLLFVVCLTGTFAVLSDEIDAIVDPAHRIDSVPGDQVDYDWSAMLQTIQDSLPEGVTQTIYAPGASGRPTGDRTAALAFVAMPTGETRKVSLDPFSGALRGHTSFFNTERFFRTLHRRLFDGARGILVVTLTSFFLLASALSGFAFYRGWWQQLRTFRLSGTRRRRWSDLHKLAGIWALPFTLLIALTGVYYFVEVAYQRGGAYDRLLPAPLAQVEVAGLADFGHQPELLPLDRYVALAREAYPDLDVRTIRPAQGPTQAVYLDGRAGDPLTRDRADRIHLHPFTGEVLDVQRTADLGIIPYLTDAVDPIHFGYFGGFATQFVWFVLGLVLSFSILSGMYVWLVRSTTSRKRPSWMLRGAPLSAGLTLVYLGVAAAGTVDGIRAYASPGNRPVPVAFVDVGPWTVRVDCELPCAANAASWMTLRFEGDGLPNYERAEIVGPDGSAFRLQGPAGRPRGRVEVSTLDEVTIRVTDRRAAVHEARFTISMPFGEAIAAPEWPDTATGVWWVVFGFTALMVGSIVVWLAMVWRVVRARKPS